MSGINIAVGKMLPIERDQERQHSPVLFAFISTFILIFLIVANIGSAKIAYLDFGFFGTYHFPSSVIFFPFVFLFTDIGTELLGFVVCRKIIWASFFGLGVLVVTLQSTVELPPSPHWSNQKEYALIFNQTPKIFIASACAFLVGDLINAYILSRLRCLTSNRFFIFRALCSTVAGALVDSILFVNIAYWGIYPMDIIWNMAITESIIKFVGVAIILPLGALYLSYMSLLNPFSNPDEQEVS